MKSNMLLYFVLVLSLNVSCWAAERYPRNDKRGRYYCPPIHEPTCASNGENYVYFESQCHLDVRNHQEKRMGQKEYKTCPLNLCYPKCKTCPNDDDPVCVIDGRSHKLKEFKNSCEVEFVACAFKKYYLFLNYGSCPNQNICSSLSCSKTLRPICISSKSMYREFSNDCEFQKYFCENKLSWQNLAAVPCFTSLSKDRREHRDFWEPICGTHKMENRTFHSYRELRTEMEKTQKEWTILHTGYCVDDKKSCRGETFKPICAVLNGLTTKSFFSPCHMYEEKRRSGQNWLTLYQGLCRNSNVKTIKPSAKNRSVTEASNGSGFVNKSDKQQHSIASDKNGTGSRTESMSLVKIINSMADTLAATIKPGTKYRTATEASDKSGFVTESDKQQPSLDTDKYKGGSGSENISLIKIPNSMSDTLDRTIKPISKNITATEASNKSGFVTESDKQQHSIATDKSRAESRTDSMSLVQIPDIPDSVWKNVKTQQTISKDQGRARTRNKSIIKALIQDLAAVVNNLEIKDEERTVTREEAENKDRWTIVTPKQARTTVVTTTEKMDLERSSTKKEAANKNKWINATFNPDSTIGKTTLEENDQGKRSSRIQATVTPTRQGVTIVKTVPKDTNLHQKGTLKVIKMNKRSPHESNEKKREVFGNNLVHKNSDVINMAEKRKAFDLDILSDEVDPVNEKDSHILSNMKTPKDNSSDKLKLILDFLHDLAVSNTLKNAENKSTFSKMQENVATVKETLNKQNSFAKLESMNRTGSFVNSFTTTTPKQEISYGKRRFSRVATMIAKAQHSSNPTVTKNINFADIKLKYYINSFDGVIPKPDLLDTEKNSAKAIISDSGIRVLPKFRKNSGTQKASDDNAVQTSWGNFRNNQAFAQDNLGLSKKSDSLDGSNIRISLPVVIEEPLKANDDFEPSPIMNNDSSWKVATSPVLGREEKLNLALTFLDELGILKDFLNRNNANELNLGKQKSDTLRQSSFKEDLNSFPTTINNGKPLRSMKKPRSTESSEANNETSKTSSNLGNKGTLSQETENKNLNSTSSNNKKLDKMDNSDIKSNKETTEVNNSSNGIPKILDLIQSSPPLTQKSNTGNLKSSKKSGNSSFSKQTPEETTSNTLDHFSTSILTNDSLTLESTTQSTNGNPDKSTEKLENSKSKLDFGILSDAVSPNKTSSNISNTSLKKRPNKFKQNISKKPSTKTSSVPLKTSNYTSLLNNTSPNNDTYKVIYNGAVYTAPASYSPVFNFITLPNQNVLLSSNNTSNTMYPFDPQMFNQWPVPVPTNVSTYPTKQSPSNSKMSHAITTQQNSHQPPEVQQPPENASQENIIATPQPAAEYAIEYSREDPTGYIIEYPYNGYSDNQLPVSSDYESSNENHLTENSGEELSYFPIHQSPSIMSSNYIPYSSTSQLNPSMSYSPLTSPASLSNYFNLDLYLDYNDDLYK